MIYVYGDNIDTDRIIPGKYTKTLDLSTLAAHVLEDLDPDFRSNVKEGDVLIAGANFGCGSSREQAPIALKQCGLQCVVASYFARIFYRNAINIGLPILEIGPHDIAPGDAIEVDIAKGKVINHTKSKVYEAARLPQVMLDILDHGGLVQYLKENGDYKI